MCVLALTACSAHNGTPDMVKDCDSVRFVMSMLPFEGEEITRTTVSGEGFEGGDKIRFKIFCPNSKSHELGETWGGFYTITVPNSLDQHDDVSFFASGTYGSYEAQATTYIYTAMNTTGTRIFTVGDYRYSRESNFFYADQSKVEFFKKSDLVWAQAVRQTGAREVHLNFKHKVARLDIIIEDEADTLSDNTILTIEGMPDIDGAELVVGDYYADESYEDYSYNYKTKCSCSYENNGKVIGIEVIDEAHSKSIVNALTGNPYPAGGASNSETYAKVPNTGTYRAYKDPNPVPGHTTWKHYMLYLPPCVLDSGENAVIWLRDGTKRYSVALDQLEFKEGVKYTQKVIISQPNSQQ